MLEREKVRKEDRMIDGKNRSKGSSEKISNGGGKEEAKGKEGS